MVFFWVNKKIRDFSTVSTGVRYGNKKMVNERKESPLFEVTNDSSLAANSIFNVNLDEQTNYGKYTPYNFVLVQNNSLQRVRLIVNDSVRKIIPAGTIQTFDASTIPAIWSIRVQNLGASAINADELSVSFQKVKGVNAKSVKILGWDI